MALFRVSNERAQFDAAGNEASDQYGAGIRFTQGGNARVTTGSATNYNQGIPMSATGQVAIVDATAGLPAGTIVHNGLPMSGDKVCVSRNATAVVSNGLPYDAAGAVAADVNFDLNFIGTDTLNSSVTFTRASTATFFDSAGVLTSAAINAPRFDYNPATLAARGLLIEEQRTNSIRNNTMQGAVAGTPGTLPTNWSASLAGGLSREVVGSGTFNGINYVDVRVFGTPTNTNLALNLYFDNATQIAALTGQTWTESVWVQMVGGSTTNITQVYLAAAEVSSGGADLAYLSGTTFLPTIGTFTRRTYTATTANASTAFIRPALWMSHSGVGNPVDITLRIGLPQLELGAFSTSVIPTTTTALTRSADVASVNTLSPWFNATEGTLFAQYIRAGLTVSGGAAGFDDGTANNMIRFVFGTAMPANQRFDVNTGGVSQATVLVNATGVVNTLYKDAGAYKLNDIAATENGAAVVVDTAATIPTVNILRLGTNPIGAYLNGWIQRVAYYPRRLSNAELQAITA